MVSWDPALFGSGYFMNMDQERLAEPAHLALCSGAKGVITLEPETVECLLSSRPWSGASPSAMTHYDLDLSVRLPFIIFFVPRFIPIICTNNHQP